MSLLLIVGPKCTLAASHGESSPGEYADGTDRDGQTVAHQTVILSPVHTSNNVEATLSNATSRAILSTKSK